MLKSNQSQNHDFEEIKSLTSTFKIGLAHSNKIVICITHVRCQAPFRVGRQISEKASSYKKKKFTCKRCRKSLFPIKFFDFRPSMKKKFVWLKSYFSHENTNSGKNNKIQQKTNIRKEGQTRSISLFGGWLSKNVEYPTHKINLALFMLWSYGHTNSIF